MLSSPRAIFVGLVVIALGLTLFATSSNTLFATKSPIAVGHASSVGGIVFHASTSASTGMPAQIVPAPTDPTSVAGFQALQAQPANAQVNSTLSPVFDIANHPFQFYKSLGTPLWITATVTNPLAVSATVTNPLGNVSRVSNITSVSGLFTIKFSLPADAPGGIYILYVSLTKGPLTSTTDVQIAQGVEASISVDGTTFSSNP
jgi:hypothetical protein